jgi:CRISPR-associated protein Cas1
MPFLRTLYIQEQGSVLTRHDERFAIKKDGEVLSEVLACKIDQIYIFGNCSITTPAMTYCLKEEIPIVLFSSRGSYYGLVESPIGDHVSLHREQFARMADPTFCLAAAKAIVAGKLHNCRVLLQRHNRTRRDPELAATVEELAGVIRKVPQAATLEELHGQEGNGAARYFAAFGRLVEPEWGFTRRVRRPPTDPINSLLSLGYTLLFYNVYALIRARGLHPYVGHLHTMRDRHPSLASDLMEELRAPVVDSLVLYILHSKLLGQSDFYRSKDASGPCLLTDSGRKVFLKQFEVKMGTKITHPSTGYVADYRRCIDLQVYQMAQYIRGEIVAYQPMLVRY